MQGPGKQRSLVSPKRKSQSRDPCIGKVRKGGHQWAALGPLPLPVANSCLRRIRRWRVPPNWSVSDWRNEMRAEAACAAWQAVCDYDPSFGAPFSAFADQRVLTRALTRHRQEWAYALRLAQEYDPEDSDTRVLDSGVPAVFDDWPGHALARLSKPDLWLIGQLFFRDRTEADIATQIGVTQQAVNKRKWMILLRLRRYMTGASSQHGPLFARIVGGKPRFAEPGPDKASKDISYLRCKNASLPHY
jgi:hypothetical protein